MPIPDTAPPPPRRSFQEIVFERLMEAVEAGSLIPGETLVEAELVQWAGVSRQPIREALSRMEDLGLVIVSPQRSTVIAPLDAQDIAHRLEVVGVLLAGVLRDGMDLFSADDRAAVVSSIEADARPFSSGGVADRAFARFGNDVATQVWERTRPHARRLLAVDPSLLPLALTDIEQKALVQSFADEDGSSARDIVLGWTDRFVQAGLSVTGAEEAS